MKINDVLNSEGHEVFIEETSWIEPGDDLEEIYNDFEEKYQKLVEFLTDQIGQPVETCDDGPGRLEEVNYGLIKWSVFEWAEDQYAVGYGHHDRETPVFLWSQKLNGS